MLKLPYNAPSVKTIGCSSKKSFDSLAKFAIEPFKVKGAMDNWLLYKILSKLEEPLDKCDYLSSLASNEQVSFTILPAEQQGVLGYNKKLEQNFSFSSQKTLFPEFIQLVKKYIQEPGSGNLYLQSTPINDLNNKLGVLNLFEGFIPMTQPRFWIGSGNQTISLHNDPYRNMITMLSGKKRVILFPPEALPHIYPAPFDKLIGGVIGSQVNAFNPDLKKFPLFKQALKKVKVAVLNPGEFLYMPPLWWHAVEGEGFNIGLNCWFFDDDKSNELRKLYLPAEPLMVGIDHESTTLRSKEDIYNNFIKSIEENDFTFQPKNKLEIKANKEAKKIKSIIDKSGLNDAQKNLWKRWVNVFAAYYVFCIKGNPFPTLNDGEFHNMVNRIKKNKAKRFALLVKAHILNFFPRILNFLKKFIRNKEEKHGIVPS